MKLSLGNEVCSRRVMVLDRGKRAAGIRHWVGRAAMVALGTMTLALGTAAADCKPMGHDESKPAKAGKRETFVGVVSDAMCGAKHSMMPGKDAECTRACVRKGSKFALVVGDKVYTLEGGSATDLDKLAGAMARVSGTVDGDTIHVSSVKAAKKAS